MLEARAVVEDLLRRCAELKILVVTAPDGTRGVREALYRFEAAVHAMERALADAVVGDRCGEERRSRG